MSAKNDDSHSKKRLLLIAVTVTAAIVLSNSVYTVSEAEQIVFTQFGKPVATQHEAAGLHVMLPFIQGINPIDKRALEWAGNPSDIPVTRLVGFRPLEGRSDAQVS